MSGLVKKLALAGAAGWLCVAASAAPLRADHPLLGTWKWTIPTARCTERMTMRQDGTSSVTSGEEVSESAIRISDRPDADGFYEWTDTITRTNGKPDCADGITPVGDVATTYPRLNAAGDQLMLCLAKKGPCFGPYVRQRP